MSDQPFTKRELDTKFEILEKTIIEGFAGVHKRQDTTNGNVLSLLKTRERFKGASIVVTLVIVPALAWLAIAVINNSTHIATITAQVKNLAK